MNPATAPIRRCRLTLGSIMVGVAGSALILGLLREERVVGLGACWLAMGGAMIEVVRRWFGLSWARAAVVVLAAYPWMFMVLVPLLASLAYMTDRLGMPNSGVASLMRSGLIALAGGVPIAAALNLVISLTLVVPVYYRGGTDADANANNLIVLPLVSWLLGFAVIVGGGITLVRLLG